MSVLSISQLSNFNVDDIKAQEKAEKKLAKAQEKAEKKLAKAQERITKAQVRAEKDGIITVKEEKKIAKAQARAEKQIAKAQEKGLYLNQGNDTISISKEGKALSKSETKENKINKIDKLRLLQEKHEGKVRGKMKRKHGKEDISTSLNRLDKLRDKSEEVSISSQKRLVEQNDQGKEVSKTPLERLFELKNQSENVNKKPLGLESPYKNFIGFMNSNDENGLLGQGSVSINLFA